MKRISLLAITVLVVTEARAITWDFDGDGNGQGWRAEESMSTGKSSGSLFVLPSEVVDGIWHIPLPPLEKGLTPAVALYSPLLDHDSALFDRVGIRFRVVHSRPLEGHMYLQWINQTNYQDQAMGKDGVWFARFREMVFTGEWQELLIGDLATGPVQGEERASPILWEGKLAEIQLHLVLSQDSPGSSTGNPEDVPEAIEIDWIKLTGVEELLQGELPPPSISESSAFGALFAEPMFSALGRRQIWGFGIFSLSRVAGGLGDIDGDGDLDLVTTYAEPNSGPQRWLYALNDGNGHFSHPNADWSTSQSPNLQYLQVGDMNMDGYLDIYEGVRIDYSRVLLNRGEEGKPSWAIASEIRIALGMCRLGSLTSSETLTRSSKPMNE